MIEIKMPIVSEDSVVQQYDDYLTQHPNVKFVLIGKAGEYVTVVPCVMCCLCVCVCVCVCMWGRGGGGHV